jgi:hypothetical protein
MTMTDNTTKPKRGVPAQFRPEMTGRGYPTTEAGWRRRRDVLVRNGDAARKAGKLSRLGVPDGWGGRHEELAEVRRNSRDASERLLPELMPETDGETLDEARARMGLGALLEITLDKSQPASLRTRACKLFLAFALPQKTIETEVRVAGGALAYLDALIAGFGDDTADS